MTDVVLTAIITVSGGFVTLYINNRQNRKSESRGEARCRQELAEFREYVEELRKELKEEQDNSKKAIELYIEEFNKHKK